MPSAVSMPAASMEMPWSANHRQIADSSPMSSGAVTRTIDAPGPAPVVVTRARPDGRKRIRTGDSTLACRRAPICSQMCVSLPPSIRTVSV